MNFTQDWTPYSWNKTNEKRKDETKEQHINRLKKVTGAVSTINKTSGNKQTISLDSSKLKKIENEEDTFVLPKVSLSMGKKIAKLRCEKKLSQKDLAFQLSLNVKVIQDYEASKAIPNPIIINKMERILGRIRE